MEKTGGQAAVVDEVTGGRQCVKAYPGFATRGEGGLYGHFGVFLWLTFCFYNSTNSCLSGEEQKGNSKEL